MRAVPVTPLAATRAPAPMLAALAVSHVRAPMLVTPLAVSRVRDPTRHEVALVPMQHAVVRATLPAATRVTLAVAPVTTHAVDRVPMRAVVLVPMRAVAHVPMRATPDAVAGATMPAGAMDATPRPVSAAPSPR